MNNNTLRVSASSCATRHLHTANRLRIRIFRWAIPSIRTVAAVVLGAFAFAVPAAMATEVIIDNTTTGSVTITGTWTASTALPGYYGTNYLHDGNTGKGTKSVRFTPNLPAAGEYKVYARWVADASRASNVPIDITFAGGVDHVAVDQRSNGGQWVPLGIYNFNAGTGGNVQINTTGTSGYVIADAVRFVDVSSPFGVSMSHSSLATFTTSTWPGLVAATGASWVRGIQLFSEIEPTQGTWQWSAVDSYLSTAETKGLNVSGFFCLNAPWINSNTQTFPVANLSAWSTYVNTLVTHCGGHVKYWEVWNEPPNFSSSGTATDYASTVVNAYNAAKSADPYCQVGLAAQSNNINWLEQTIKAGAADHFDYITLHPYEQLDAVTAGWEAEFMSMIPTLRKMFAAQDPAKANVPVWFTEIGAQLNSSPGNVTITADIQGHQLVKAYSMALAQGVARIDWFEGKDGDSGPFGLISSTGTLRPSYTALSKLIQYLGARPQYLGWLLLNNQDYGFVFQGATTTVLVTWAPPGVTDTVNFGQSVQIIDPLTGAITNASSYALTNAPMLVNGVPSALVTQAQGNVGLPFPWGGDYSNASSVSVTMGGPNTDQGLHQLYADATSTAVTAYGGPARYCAAAGVQSFTVDPNFLSYTTTPIQITAVVRRDSVNDNAGFNLKYESTSGWKATGSWYTVPGNTQWYTKTWVINDAQFVGKWGFNFSFDSDSTSLSKYYIQSVSVQKLTINFNNYAITSYATGQDFGTATVQDSGATLLLSGNTWKKINFPYTVTANTKLEFDFKCTQEGEVHGLGLDVDNSQDTDYFQLYGTQISGRQNYNNYLGGGVWTHYTIPVGQFFTGTRNYLYFISDKDAAPTNASDSYFRNVQLHE